MSITASELILYGSANRPEDDTSTAGGAIATAARPLDSQFSAAAQPEAVSDGVDARTLTIEGRLADGSIVSEANALNDTTPVLFTNSFERVLNMVLSAADGARTVTVKEGSGGTTRHTFNPNETDAYIHYQRSASEAAPTTRYEKDFWKNTNATLALTSAEVTLTADPAAKIKIALANAVDDTESVANRETAPAAVGTFTDDGVAIAVPGGSLGAGVAIGTWAELSLAADDPAQKTTYTVQLAGQTT